MISHPRKILLATDLSVRSDRAQDRAVSLMKQYGSELIVLHVLESLSASNSIRRIPFLPFHNYNEIAIEKARRRLLDYLSDIRAHVSVQIEEGDPFETIMRVAKEKNCDLIVTGVARNETLGRFTLGKTVDRLLRKSDISLLIVTERSRSQYNKIVVATDLSAASKHAIETAVAFFPYQKLSVLYAYTAPKSSAVDNMENYREQMRRVAHKDLSSFLDKVDMTADQRIRINMIIEHGSQSKLLKDFVQLSDAELVVLGSSVRGILSYYFLGGHAKRAISSLSCDALVVRGHS